MRKRLCPLCDQDWEATTCPVHAVPTIGPAQAVTKRLEIGTTLVDRFRIVGLLGQGGMGALLSAEDLQTGVQAVVKVLRGERVGEIANVRRFYQEARAASALSHPNIVKILLFGIDEATRAPFLAMEFVPGRTLKAMVSQDGPLPEADAAAIFVPIARALGAAHRAQVLHRDLKPSNIMVDNSAPGLQVKVLDFGLAKILEDPATAPLTQPGKTVGTPAFMSPEQVTQRPQDFRTDLYGLGCVLHAALTGGPPFTGGDLIEVMRKQMREPPPPLPPALSDGQPPSSGLRALHASLLAKNPSGRPSSTESVVKAFIDMQVQATAGAAFDHLDHLETQIDLLPTAEHTSTQSAEHPAEAPTSVFDPTAERTDSHQTQRTEVLLARPESHHPSLIAPEDTAPEDTARVDVLVAQTDRASAAQAAPERLVTPPPVPAAPGRIRRYTGGLADALAGASRERKWTAAGAAIGAGLLLGLVWTVTPSGPPTARDGGVLPAPPAAQMHPRPQVIATPAVETSATEPMGSTIEVRTSPSGADATLDGENAGRTPIEVDRPAATRSYRMRLEHVGFHSHSIELKHDTPSPIEVRLRPR